MIGIPLQDNYEATLTQALIGDSGALTIYVSKTPTCTIPSGHEVVLTINPGKGQEYQENVLMEAYNATLKTITIKTGGRAQERYNGDTPSPLNHSVGSKIIMSDAYPVWNSLDDAVLRAGDTMSGQLNFTGTNHAGVKMISLTTAERLALTPANGMIVYDTDAGELYQCIGGSWYVFSAGSTQPNASETVAGKVELATDAEREAGTSSGGTGARLVPTNDALVKTSSGATDENHIPILNASGKLATGFIPTDVAIPQLATEGLANETITNKDVLTLASTGRLARGNASAVTTTFPFAGIAKAGAASAGDTLSYAPMGAVVEIPELSLAELARGIKTYGTEENQTQNTATDTQGASTQWRGQTFTASSNAWENNIAMVRVLLTKNNAPGGSCTLRIYATSGGLPTGAELGSKAVAYADISAGASVVDFEFATPIALTAGNVYAIVLDPGAGVGGANTVAWHYQNTDVYPGGQSCTSADSGVNWTAETTFDRYFRMQYASVVGVPAFIDDVNGAVTLGINAAGSNKYNQRIGYCLDRSRLLLDKGLRNIYATYTFTANSTAVVNTEITIGMRPMLIFASLSATGYNFRGSMGVYMDGGFQSSLENKYTGVQAGGVVGFYGGHAHGSLAKFNTINLATDANHMDVRLVVGTTTANTVNISRSSTLTGALSVNCAVYLNIIGF